MRRIFAEIEIDEQVATNHAEVNGIEDSAPIAFLEHEFGWLEQSGITLKYAYIADDDDPEERARYINYVMGWAEERSEDFDKKDSPMSYETWLRSDKGAAGSVVVANPKELATKLIDALGKGEPTEHGDRTSGYFRLARDKKEHERVAVVSLIEEVHGLDCDMRGYAVHYINNIEMENCKIYRTEHLDGRELESLLSCMCDNLQRGESHD